MARSKPKFRQQNNEKRKKGTSCPCIQEISAKEENNNNRDEITLNQPETRLISVADVFQPTDEYVDLESFSEASSFGIQGDTPEITGIGDQFEEGATYLSGGNVSSGVDPDSEPMEEGSVPFEKRKLNIAATVMSWLDNYGQARGYRLDSNGTSLMIQTDEISGIDSGSIDIGDEAKSKNSKCGIVHPTPLKQQLILLEKACSTLINFRNDLEPLNKMTKSSVNWGNIQQVLSTWANLMSTVWKRSQEGNVTPSELYIILRLSENLESLASQVSPVNLSVFANPVVKLNLGKTQGFINLALKWAKEIGKTGNMEDFNQISGEISSWTDSMKTISTVANEQLKIVTIKYAKNVLDNCTKFTLYPKYELILFDVIPSKTSAGWMFFGKVELRALLDNEECNKEEIKKQININSIDSGLSIKFWSSLPRTLPCIDYGALFHIVCRACCECTKYYEQVTNDLLKATKYLKEPLIPDSIPKNFDKVSKMEQNSMMNHIFAQIWADQIMESTVTTMDEILRSFHLLIVYMIKILKRFIKSIKHQGVNDLFFFPHDKGPPFKELVVPLETVSNTLFQTIRRFQSLGPIINSSSTNSTILDINSDKIKTNSGRHASLLTIVNTFLEGAINSLYSSSSHNIFTFQQGIQTIFTISQLRSEPEFERKASLDPKMKNLVLYHLNALKKVDKEANSTFKMMVGLTDDQIKITEKAIDVTMKKATKLGIIIPARTSGVSFSHVHGKFTILRYNRNPYIRHQAKQLVRRTNEVHRHTRKYVAEPDYEIDHDNNNFIDGK